MTAPMPKAGRPRKPYNPDEPKKTVKDECVFYPDARFLLKKNDHTGKRDGKLTYLYFVGRHYIRGNYWLAQCKCGNEIVTRWGNAKSCGCQRTESIRKRVESYKINRALGIKTRTDKDKHDTSLPDLSKFKKSAFDRLTHCTAKRATYREMCRHYIECQDERVFGGKMVSSRFDACLGRCYESPVDEQPLGRYQLLII